MGRKAKEPKKTISFKVTVRNSEKLLKKFTPLIKKADK